MRENGYGTVRGACKGRRGVTYGLEGEERGGSVASLGGKKGAKKKRILNEEEKRGRGEGGGVTVWSAHCTWITCMKANTRGGEATKKKKRYWTRGSKRRSGGGDGGAERG